METDKVKVIYEDNHILVVIKDQNVLSQGDETGDENMVDLIKQYLKEKYNKPGNVYVGLVHRLDRPTGGVMVFAKTSKAAARLSHAISAPYTDKAANAVILEADEETFDKRYLAVVVGALKDKKATLVHYLDKNEVTNVVEALSYAKEGAKRAELSYEVLTTREGPASSISLNDGTEVLNPSNRLNLVEVCLVTGRSHQIRAQMSAIRAPIFGDAKYGGSKLAKGWNMALWAYKLAFIHPVTKAEMVFTVYPPLEALPWKHFEAEISKLK